MKKNDKSELVGVKEIARRAEVSIGTVDRVLNNRVGVSPKTRDKILAIIKDLDYQPNIMARRLASRKVLKIAVLIPSVSSETGYWNAPLNGINQAAQEIKTFGVKVVNYFFNQNDKKTFDQQAKVILQENYHGVLLAPMFEREAVKFLNHCDHRHIPYVLINSDLEGNRVCYIGPNLYQSGYLAAHLSKYLVENSSNALIINISKEIDLHHHLLKKEEGFRAYFANGENQININKIDIRNTDYDSIKNLLNKAFRQTKPALVFVTNSRVSAVARYFEEEDIQHIKLIGYDFLVENVAFMKKGTIDFLICQKPQEQGYKGIMTVYQHLMDIKITEKTKYMPIDILTRENYQYYNN